MWPIPLSLRSKLSSDSFMRRCVITGEQNQVSFEHCWVYAGRQINEDWAIVPLRRDLNVNMQADVKDRCRWVSLGRATEKDLAKYPKRDWKNIKKFLQSKYGHYTEERMRSLWSKH